MNRALLDTDTFSELGKAIDPTVARNGAAYLAAFGRYTVSVVTVMEIVRGPVPSSPPGHCPGVPPTSDLPPPAPAG